MNLINSPREMCKPQNENFNEMSALGNPENKLITVIHKGYVLLIYTWATPL